MPHTYTGMTRRIDTLGRIVIPVELRKSFNLDVGTRVIMETDKTALGSNWMLTAATKDSEVGMSRQIDHVGRVVVPADFRREAGWEIGDFVEFIIDKNSQGKRLILRKVVINCSLCNRSKDLHNITIPAGGATREIKLCRGCIQKIKELELH